MIEIIHWRRCWTYTVLPWLILQFQDAKNQGAKLSGQHPDVTLDMEI